VVVAEEAVVVEAAVAEAKARVVVESKAVVLEEVL
jgi:hypothetical protein